MTARVAEATKLIHYFVCAYKTQKDVNQLRAEYTAEKRNRSMDVPEELSTMIFHAIKHTIVDENTMRTLDKIQECKSTSTNNADPSSGTQWVYSRATLHMFMQNNAITFCAPR